MLRVERAEGSTRQRLHKVLCASSEVLCGVCSFSSIKYGSKLCGGCQNTLLDSSLAAFTPSECLDVSVSLEKHMPRLQFILLQNKPVLALFLPFESDL